MKRLSLIIPIITLVLVLSVVSCRGIVAPAPNVDATVAAAVAATRTASDVQEKVAATLRAPAPTSTPRPTSTPQALGLVSSGYSFKFQYACINPTLDPCILLDSPGGMVDRIRERTNGQIEIEVSSYPELRLAGPDTLRLVKDGTLGMAEIYGGYVGGELPMIDVANLLGLLPDVETNWKTIDAVSEPLHDIIEERSKGVVLAESYYGNNYFYTKKPWRTRWHFEGMKIRAHSTMLADLINGMGADVQFVAFSEVYTALERGILDAAVTCGPCGAGLRWFEVADYLNGPIISIGVTYITINKDRWEEIPADLQAIMREEALIHQEKNRELVESTWDPAGITDNVAGGMEFVEFSAELKAALKQASIDVVIPNWVERNGGHGSAGVKMFNEFVSPIIGVTIGANGKVRQSGRSDIQSTDKASRQKQEQDKSKLVTAPSPKSKAESEQITASQVSGRILHLSDIYAAPGASEKITVTFQNTSNVTTHYRLEDSGNRGGWKITKECMSVVEGDCETKNVSPGNIGRFDYSVRAPTSGSSTATWVLKATHGCDSFRCQTADVDRQMIQLSVR